MRTVAITGASKGLGRALAEELTAKGHRVYGGARTSPEDLGFTPSFEYRRLDVTSAQSLNDWFASMPELPDLVVANAGLINANAPLWEVPEAEFRQVMDVNVVGPYLTFKAFQQRVEGSAPSVFVALSSTWGRSTSAEVAPYCASKWAIEGMIKALAQEVSESMAVVALNPGVIATDMLRSCFGAAAEHYPGPQQWAREAAPAILGYDSKVSGRSLSI